MVPRPTLGTSIPHWPPSALRLSASDSASRSTDTRASKRRIESSCFPLEKPPSIYSLRSLSPNSDPSPRTPTVFVVFLETGGGESGTLTGGVQLPRRGKFFFSAPSFVAPRRGRTQRTGRERGGGENRAWTMWIWYLLLGSGSGSRTVGKFHASTVTVLMWRRWPGAVWWWSGGKWWGGLAKAPAVCLFCAYYFTPKRDKSPSLVKQNDYLPFASTDRLFFANPRQLGAPRVRSCVSSCFTGGGREKSPCQPWAWICIFVSFLCPVHPFNCVFCFLGRCWGGGQSARDSGLSYGQKVVDRTVLTSQSVPPEPSWQLGGPGARLPWGEEGDAREA